MVNHFKLSIASLLTAGAVSLGGIGVATLITNNFKSASADVASVYAEDDPSIGVGEANKATVTVEGDVPVTFTLNEGVVGQYYLALKIADRDPDTFYSFSARIPGETEEDDQYAYFAYNSYADAYIATVNVAAGDQIILTGYNENAVTLDAYLLNLFMGASTENGIYGLLINKDLSKTVQVENVEPNTYIAVLQTYDELAEGTTFSIKLSDGEETPLVYDANMYGYIADVTFTDETTSFTVSTSSATTVSVDFYLQDKVTVNTALPEDEEHEVEFTQYAPQNFYYIAKTSGFYAISAVTETTNAEFAFELKTNPDYPMGEMVEEKTYPMYLVAGQRYYFTVTYLGLRDTYENVPTTVKAYFTLGEWTATPITLNSSVYVPVTLESNENHITVPLNGVAGNTYDMYLFGVPEGVENVYMHYGETRVTFNTANGFMAEITLVSDSLNVYFTTDYGTPFPAMVQFVYAPYTYEDTITLGTAHTIDLRAQEDRVYFINDLPAGTYQITLSGNNANISVEDVYGNVIVEKGNTTGYFDFTPYDAGAETGTQSLLFRNAGTSNYTFTATVTLVPVEDNTIELGETKQITLGAKESKDYTIELVPGEYVITLAYPDGSQIEVYFDGEITVAAGVTSNLFDVAVSGTHILTFTNLAEAEVTFTVTVVAFD